MVYLYLIARIIKQLNTNIIWSACDGISFRYYDYVCLCYGIGLSLGDEVVKEKFNEYLFWFGASCIASFGLYMSMVN